VRRVFFFGIVAVASLSAGCAARSDNIYAQDVTKVFNAQGSALTDCQAQAVKQDASAAGTVAVKFKVKEKTGAFVDPAIIPEKTTAPESLQQCVLTYIPGLKLMPGDNRPAAATYEFVFSPVAGATASADTGSAPAGPMHVPDAPVPPAQ
jgi:hypothetical protein